MDLAHGVPYYPRAQVRAVTLQEVVQADVVVFAAGRNGRPDETRLQLLADNMRVAAEIGRRLAGSPGLVVVVSNPVDVLTRVVQQSSGLPPARVLGTGTMLDTARLRERLGQHLGVDARSVHAHVLGEHGDSEFVQWSAAQVGGRPLRNGPAGARPTKRRLGIEVRRAAYEIIQRKGMTNHAIGLVTADLVRAIGRDEHRVLTVSRLQDGPADLADVALSLPAVVSAPTVGAFGGIRIGDLGGDDLAGVAGVAQPRPVGAGPTPGGGRPRLVERQQRAAGVARVQMHAADVVELGAPHDAYAEGVDAPAVARVVVTLDHQHVAAVAAAAGAVTGSGRVLAQRRDDLDEGVADRQDGVVEIEELDARIAVRDLDLEDVAELADDRFEVGGDEDDLAQSHGPSSITSAAPNLKELASRHLASACRDLPVGRSAAARMSQSVAYAMRVAMLTREDRMLHCRVSSSTPDAAPQSIVVRRRCAAQIN
jgi:L-lactate dehydrogenase